MAPATSPERYCSSAAEARGRSTAATFFSGRAFLRLGPVSRLQGRLLELPGTATSDAGFTARLELESGAQVAFDVSTVAPEPSGHVVRIRGELGSLALENPELGDYMRGFGLEWQPRGSPARQVALPPPGADPSEPLDGRIAPFCELAGRLIDAARTGGTCSPSVREGLRAQQLAAALQESSRSGGWVSTAGDVD